MGCFSWMYADTNNRHPLLIGESAYVITPDGSNIFESCYSGYGVLKGTTSTNLLLIGTEILSKRFSLKDAFLSYTFLLQSMHTLF